MAEYSQGALYQVPRLFSTMVAHSGATRNELRKPFLRLPPSSSADVHQRRKLSTLSCLSFLPALSQRSPNPGLRLTQFPAPCESP